MAFRRKKGFTATRSEADLAPSAHVHGGNPRAAPFARGHERGVRGVLEPAQAAARHPGLRGHHPAVHGHAGELVAVRAPREPPRVRRPKCAGEAACGAPSRSSRARSVALVAAGVAGTAAFFGSLDSRMGLAGSDASSALAAAKEGEPFYALVAADLDEVGSAGAVEGPDALALRSHRRGGASSLGRVDPREPQGRALGRGGASRARRGGASGDAALVKAVARFRRRRYRAPREDGRYGHHAAR